MSKNKYTTEPPLKLCEWAEEQGGGAYIAFEEYVDIPGLEDADISFEFKRDNSFEEIRELVSELKRRGFQFVVRK